MQLYVVWLEIISFDYNDRIKHAIHFLKDIMLTLRPQIV